MKVALCIPSLGNPAAAFVSSLARMIVSTLKTIPALEIETFVAHGSILVEARTCLFDWARDWGAERILWLDNDHTFPPEALVKLLVRRVAMVGANYPRRHADRVPTALRRGADGGWELVETTAAKVADDALEEVDRIGFGLLLMDIATVLAALGDDLYPLFEMRSTPDGRFEGEDWLLCDRLRMRGVPIHVDHALSAQTGHIQQAPIFFMP